MSEKSILEQALLRVNTLEEAVKQNAKGILSSVMKQELNELLKENQEEEVEAVTEPEEMMGMDEAKPTEEAEKDMSVEAAADESKMEETEAEDDEESAEDEAEDEEKGEDEADNLGDLDNEDELSDKDIESMDSDMEEPEMEEPEMEAPEMGEPDSMMGDDDVLDMTGASDDEVVKVFKKMKPEDQVVVKKDGDDIELEVEDDQFIIKLDEEENKMEETVESEEETEETVYEIELGEESEEEETEEWKEEATETEEKEVEKVEASEAARTKSNPHGDKGGANRAGLKSKTKYKAGSGQINEEVETLKKQNAEYKKALVLFKEKLNEVAVFNANLAYATRLFTEHSTTKKEKMDILKRFDSISSLNESKNLYTAIKTELETRKPVTESVVEKISNTPTTSTSTEVLAESKAYENPQFRRMKDLMAKIK